MQRGGRTRRCGPLAVWAAMVARLVSTVTAVPAGAQATGCAVDYTVANQWPRGFTANVVITSTGTAVDGWTLTWEFLDGQQIAQTWNADVNDAGPAASVSKQPPDGGSRPWPGELAHGQRQPCETTSSASPTQTATGATRSCSAPWRSTTTAPACGPAPWRAGRPPMADTTAQCSLALLSSTVTAASFRCELGTTGGMHQRDPEQHTDLAAGATAAAAPATLRANRWRSHVGVHLAPTAHRHQWAAAQRSPE